MNITKFESFFDDDTYNQIKNYVDDLRTNKSTQFITNLAWDKNLVNTSGLIARYSFDSSDLTIFKNVKNEIEKKIPYFVSSGVVHLLPPLSYITWHSDPHCKAALTIYLNEKWEDNWGGYLMYKENDDILAIKPTKNLGVLQKTPLNHCVSTINIGADYRISLQFFLTDEKKSLT